MFLLLPRSEVGGEGVWGGQDKVGGVLRSRAAKLSFAKRGGEREVLSILLIKPLSRY